MLIATVRLHVKHDKTAMKAAGFNSPSPIPTMIEKLKISCVDDVATEQQTSPTNVIELPMITKFRADKSLSRNPVTMIVKLVRKWKRFSTVSADVLLPAKNGSNIMPKVGMSDTLKIWKRSQANCLQMT